MAPPDLVVREAPEPGFARVVEVSAPSRGLWATIALHSLRRGPAFGGIRCRSYDDHASARRDALALAHAMSRKCALAQLDAGGGKTVLRVAPELDREDAFATLGQVIEDLQGHYVCGPDAGTHAEDLDVIRQFTRHVNPRQNDAGASTAAGVLAGVRALVGDAHPSLRVAVEGLGSVGGAVCRQLGAQGAAVWGADPNAAARAGSEAACERVFDDAQALDLLGCELFMPCALGGTVRAERFESPARAPRWICGSANNQLADATQDEALHAAGIVWAPDIVVSAGAVIEGVLTYAASPDASAAARSETRQNAGASLRRQVASQIADIEGTLREVLAHAQRADIGPGEAARRIADARLA